MKPLDGLGLAAVAAAATFGVVLMSPGNMESRTIQLDYALPPSVVVDYEFGEGGFRALTEVMEEAFGSHAAPKLPDEADAEGLGIAAGQLATGREQFRVKCMHCHGTNGGGDGPTAQFLNPRPRNFRLGKIKFTSTAQASPPTRSDILFTLKRGLAGSSMPSFVTETDEHLQALVGYVQYLMIRGEVASLTAYELDDNGEVEEFNDQEISYEELKEAAADYLAEQVEFVAGKWADASDSIVIPSVPRGPLDLASAERGRELFLSATTECSACHGDTGRGKGANVYDAESDTYKRQDDWGNDAIPADLTRGLYRGGDRPLDLFRRMHSGIKGSIMPGFAGNLSEGQMWDVVNYVYSLRYDITE
ncbi:MAG TPA: cytochrome c [Planctomycetota bacterium]